MWTIEDLRFLSSDGEKARKNIWHLTHCYEFCLTCVYFEKWNGKSLFEKHRSCLISIKFSKRKKNLEIIWNKKLRQNPHKFHASCSLFKNSFFNACDVCCVSVTGMWINETVRWAPMVVRPFSHLHTHTYSPYCMYWYFVSFLLYSFFFWITVVNEFAFGTARTWPYTQRRGSISIPFHLCTYIVALAIRFNSIHSFTECVPSSRIRQEWERRKQNKIEQPHSERQVLPM